MAPVATLPQRAVRRTLSRTEAFKVQGVSLKFPTRSWSGVRWEDGVVVIAMREADIEVRDKGSRCLLWTPVIEGATSWSDSPSKRERLGHCRLAALHGGAGGLIVCGEAARVNAEALIPLRVEKRRDEYWATWGSSARVVVPLRSQSPA